MTAALDAQLLEAHARSDGPALARLYAQAACAAPDIEARAFFLTHAMIYALEAGAPEASHLRAQLVAMGREACAPARL